MGLLFSRFRKKTTVQVLDELEKKIRSIEQYGYNTEQERRRVIGILMVFSIGLYVLAVLFFYLYFRLTNWKEAFLYATPLLVFPIVIIILRTSLTKYYEWKLDRNKTRLIDLRAEKKKILEEVMDKETYKYAKEILDKFGDNREIVPLIAENRFNSTPIKSTSLVPVTPVNLRQRISTPTAPKLEAANNSQTMKYTGRIGFESPLVSKNPDIQLPRPILSVGSGAFDRLVDYLVGEGPGSRFALICAKCYSHNGMALPEEFDYLSYRCAYCKHLNSAKKQKPKAPPLTPSPLHNSILSSKEEDNSIADNNSDSVEDKHSNIDSEPETETKNKSSVSD